MGSGQHSFTHRGVPYTVSWEPAQQEGWNLMLSDEKGTDFGTFHMPAEIGRDNPDIALEAAARAIAVIAARGCP